MQNHVTVVTRVYARDITGVDETGDFEIETKPAYMDSWAKIIECDAPLYPGIAVQLGENMAWVQVQGLQLHLHDGAYVFVPLAFISLDQAVYESEMKPGLEEGGWELQSHEEAPEPEGEPEEQQGIPTQMLEPHTLEWLRGVEAELGTEFGIAFTVQALDEALAKSVQSGQTAWVSDPHAAFIYAVLTNCAQPEFEMLKARHGWTDDDITGVRIMQAFVARARQWAVTQAPSETPSPSE